MASPASTIAKTLIDRPIRLSFLPLLALGVMSLAGACSDNSGTPAGTGSSSGSSSGAASGPASGSSSGSMSGTTSGSASGSASGSSNAASGTASGAMSGIASGAMSGTASGAVSGSTSGAGSGGTTGSSGAPSDGGAGDAAGASDANGAFALTSSAILEGAMFPTANTCSGANTSPPFAWTAGPAATMSYAIVLTDLDNNNLRHWVLWDIPPGTMSLPANLAKTRTLTMPAGAKQVSIQNGGYAGPCPPAGVTHTYEFALYAIDVAMLPGVTTNSMPMAVETVVLAHQIGKTTLTGKGMR